MAALDLLGRRWALRVLWELRDGRPVSFRELRERCDQMSTSVLNQRLTRAAGGRPRGGGGGRLRAHAPRARSCTTALAPLDGWAKRWASSK